MKFLITMWSLLSLSTKRNKTQLRRHGPLVPRFSRFKRRKLRSWSSTTSRYHPQITSGWLTSSKRLRSMTANNQRNILLSLSVGGLILKFQNEYLTRQWKWFMITAGKDSVNKERTDPSFEIFGATKMLLEKTTTLLFNRLRKSRRSQPEETTSNKGSATITNASSKESTGSSYVKSYRQSTPRSIWRLMPRL